MELPKYILGDNTDFPNAIFVIHTDFPRFIINLEDDEVEWLEDFDQHDEKELELEMENLCSAYKDNENTDLISDKERKSLLMAVGWLCHSTSHSARGQSFGIQHVLTQYRIPNGAGEPK